MALALRLFLLLLLAVALPARAAQAAPLQVRGADEHARKISPAARLHEDLQPLKPPAGVSTGRTFQAPFLLAAQKPGDHRREMEREAVLNAQFPRGSRGSLAASAAGREAMPGTVPGDWDHDLRHLETLIKHGFRILDLGGAEPDDEEDPDDDNDPFDEEDPVNEDVLDSQPIVIIEPRRNGVSAERAFPGPLVDVARKRSSHRRRPLRRKIKPIGAGTSLEESKHLEKKRSDVVSQRDAAGTSTHADNAGRRVFCWGSTCLIKLMAIVAGAAICLMMFCAGIWYCWKRKECSCESSEEEPNNSGRENFPRDPSCPLLPLSALPWLQHRHEPFPKPSRPKRDPLPLSPLVLFPGQD